MDEDTVDTAIMCKNFVNNRKIPTIETLNSEMPCRAFQKDRGKRMFKTLLNRLRMRKSASANISEPDPMYKVAYLGNVVTGWAKGEGCVEKPLATLWRNYTQSSRPDVRMQLTVSGGGLKATTKDHGLTEYWANRLTTCSAPVNFPRLFCWVYRHEGRRLRHELRCHAVLCSTNAIARQIEAQLKNSLALALAEFKRDKLNKQNARLSLVNSVYENPTMPRRKILLSTGSHNYRPPLERSKSAPKLTSIEENLEEDEEIFEGRSRNLSNNNKILRHYDSTGALLDKRKNLMLKLNETYKPSETIVPVYEDTDSRYDDDDDEECENICRVRLDDNSMSTDIKSNMIIEQLAQESMKSDLIESCERSWFRNLGETPDLIPLDSDEGSLSSGCESASTVTSDLDQPVFSTISEVDEELISSSAEMENTPVQSKGDKKKTDIDFKVGGCVLARVRSLERIANTDMRKYCGLQSGISILDNDEVSLIPVGESQADFSSLKVYKRRSNSEPGRDYCGFETDGNHGDVESEEENGSACSDESGYDEVIDCASSVSNIILV